MPILGAHMSTAGGLYRAVERAAEVGCDCLQLFSKSPNRWQAKPITSSEIDQFRDAIDRHAIGHVLVHDAYLVNLAAPDDTLWQKSVAAYADELHRAAQLNVKQIVMHPGSFTTSDEPSGLKRVAQGLDRAYRQQQEKWHDDIPVTTLLETTAGQGTNLGRTFEQLARILELAEEPAQYAICVDTCHIFSAGYDLRTKDVYQETFERFDEVLGLDQIRAFHLNDTKNGFGSRVDRHQHIGEGELGLESFRLLLNDSRFERVPMYLETPKVDDYRQGLPSDEVNLATLRSLVKKQG